MTKDRKSGAPHRANWFKLILGWIFLVLGVAGLVPTLLGLAAGIALRGRLDQKRFRQGIVVIIVGSVLNLLRGTFLV